MRVLLLLLLAIHLHAQVLISPWGVHTLSDALSNKDLADLLNYNTGEFPESISPALAKHIESTSLPFRPKMGVILQLGTKAIRGEALPSCTFSAKLNSLLNSLSEDEQGQLTFDLCRLKTHLKQSTSKIKAEQFFFLPLIYKNRPQEVIAILSELAKNESIQMLITSSYILPQPRMLQTESESGELVIDEVNFQIYVWFPVVLAFVLFFAVMAMCSLDFSNDTILYAKFISSDKM